MYRLTLLLMLVVAAVSSQFACTKKEPVAQPLAAASPAASVIAPKSSASSPKYKMTGGFVTPGSR